MTRRTKQAPFAGYPGMGTLLCQKQLANGVTVWQGPMNLADGTKVFLDGLHDPKSGYTVRVKNAVGLIPSYEVMTEFRIPSFKGSKLAKDVSTELTGRMKIYPAFTREEQPRPCVRITCVTESGKPDIVDVP